MDSRIRKQEKHLLLSNILIFSFLFICFGMIIYHMTKTTIYFQVDNVIEQIFQNKDITEDKRIRQVEKTSRYTIRIVRWSDDGKILNDETIDDRNMSDSLFKQLSLDKNDLNRFVCKEYKDDDSNVYYRSMTKPYMVKGKKTYVEVLVAITQIHEAAGRFRKSLFFYLIIFTLLSFIISYYLAKLAMKPIIRSWRSQQRFVEDASHELRTPLTVIQAKLEQLFTHPRHTIIEESENIAISLNEVRRLEQLIKDLSFLAKSDSSALVIHEELHDIHQFIDQAVSPYCEIAEMKDRHLTIENHTPHLKLWFDSQKIHQLLVILIDNAMKYTKDEGQIVVVSKTTPKHWIIEVKDNGIGASDEDKQHLFDRFYRVDSSRSRETGGTGLGLSIAQWIVNSHDGTITALDNSPKGLIIRVVLPLQTEERNN